MPLQGSCPHARALYVADAARSRAGGRRLPPLRAASGQEGSAGGRGIGGGILDGPKVAAAGGARGPDRGPAPPSTASTTGAGCRRAPRGPDRGPIGARPRTGRQAPGGPARPRGGAEGDRGRPRTGRQAPGIGRRRRAVARPPRGAAGRPAEARRAEQERAGRGARQRRRRPPPLARSKTEKRSSSRATSSSRRSGPM